MARSKVLAAFFIALCLLIRPTAVAQASNFEPWFANGSHHMFYESLSAAWATASDNARTLNLNPTDINTVMTSTHDLADVAVYDQNDGDAGYYGYYQCVMASSSTVCSHAHAVFNTFHSIDATRKHSVACHEFGHSLGLKDQNIYTSCMRDDALFPTIFSPHDKAHINGRY